MAWSAAQRRAGGQALAAMHALCHKEHRLIGRTRDRAHVLREGLARLPALGLAGSEAFGREVERFLAVDLAANAARLAAQPFGPVHHDLNPGNVFFDAGGELKAIIDFDEAHDAPLLMDLMMAFHYLAVDEEGRLRLSDCRDLIAGYDTKRRLTREETGLLQFCWDLASLTDAMAFVLANVDWLHDAAECRSFSRLYLQNRSALAAFSSL